MRRTLRPMLYYLVAALLLAHAVYWGAGLALLLVPRAWRRIWWVFAAPIGWALQSAVVWFGAHGPWRGTDAYALATQVLPLLLGGLAFRRHGWPGVRGLTSAGLAVVVAGALLLWPLGQRSAWSLTSSSLGACDHADYAAGARVLGEFARGDRIGFLDLPEVTRVGQVERFFDYWLQLNHFTPAAVLAHNGSVFGLDPHQAVSVTSAAFWLACLPLVLPIARIVGWRRRRRVVACLLLALSPVGAYAVHHAALGQLLATQGAAMLTLALTAAAGSRGRLAWRCLPLAFAAVWLIAGSYNFFLLIAAGPAGLGLLLVAAAGREWRPLARAAGLGVAAVALCGAVFPGRFLGLAERFRLFEQYDFGWVVPLLTPEGWLGAVRNSHLAAWDGWRAPLAVAAVAFFAAGLRLLPRTAAARAAGWVLAVAAGWAILAWESRVRPNASYDAYKVVAVFLPLLVPAMMAWFGASRSAWSWAVPAGWLALAAVGSFAISSSMVHPPLRVDRAMLEIRKIEQMPRIKSLNLRVDRFWSRLWANAFLLRKPHYFATHTYEGRLNTELRGAWDLRDNPLRSLPESPDDAIVLNQVYHLVRADAPGLVDLRFGENWFNLERDGEVRWKWAGDGPATILLRNPASVGVPVRASIRARSPQRDVLVVRLGAVEVGRAEVRREWQTLEAGLLTLPPGDSRLEFETLGKAVPGGPTDGRLLSFALAELTLKVDRESGGMNDGGR